MTVKGQGVSGGDYDRGQRAYELTFDRPGLDRPVSIEVKASSESPAVNLCLILKNVGEQDFEVLIDGQKLQRGKHYHIGAIRTIEGTDVALWLYKTSEKPFRISLNPV
jgi:hypothetical protein